jgi:glycosyltransferase involved in cell wall biosynthesis
VSDLVGRRIVLSADATTALRPGSLSNALIDEGLDVVGVSPPGPFGAHLQALGILWVPLRRSRSAGSPAATVPAVVELVRLFRRLRPDIVHVHGPGTGIAACVAARVARVPGVVRTVPGTVPGNGGRQRRSPGGRLPERLAGLCAQVVLVDRTDSASWPGVPAGRLVALAPGVDLEHFRPRRSLDEVASARAALGVGPTAVVVGTAGPVGGDGMRRLAAVAERVQVLRPDVVFVVTDPGEGDPGDAPVAGPANVVHAAGHDDPAALHAGLDLVLLLTVEGEVPGSVVEAVAGGLPVVATDGPVGRRVVDTGVNGILVPRSDVGALAEAVTVLAGDPALRGTMGVRSRIKAKSEFDERSTVRAILDAYRRLLPGTTRIEGDPS